MKPEQISRAVTSNQQHVHEHLYRILQKHRQCPFQKPFSKHTLEAFAFAKQVIEKAHRPVILDSGCGTGESVRFLARQYPNHLVLGIDKSLVRLQKNPYFQAYSGENILILRAEMFDFWRLLVQSGVQVDKHF
ncbi:MAG: SAM-dependent methyltransferase, partial [Calditrichaeota bacterium]